jgi:hypothetical protein
MANQNDPCEIFFRNSILRSRYPTATKLGELSQFFFAIFASVQFAFDRFKSFDGFIYIFQAVNSCWNQTQNNHALRYNRVNHNAAEYVEILTQVVGQVCGLWNGSVQYHRRYRGGGDANVESGIAQTILQCVGDRPQFLA